MSLHFPSAFTAACFAAITATAFSLPRAAHAAPRASVNINAAARGRQESPHMWGLFIENICHDVDGGLYAQMIQNPDFKNDVPPSDCRVVNGKWISPDGHRHNPPRGGPLLAWRKIAPAGGHVSFKLLHRNPLSKAHRLSLQVTVSGASGGAANTGYWGMPLRKAHSYVISFYARAPKGGGVPLTIQLGNTTNATPSGAANLRITGTVWKRYTCRLTASRTTHHGELRFIAAGPAVFDLNLVLMFPVNAATGRPEFFRHDIVRMLKRLHAGFLRVPGGNFIEGYSLADTYHWRKTVGPMINRPGHVNYWGYRDTDGFGYMGWLELANRIHAAPLYCTNAGLLWNEQTIPGTRLQPFIHRMLTAAAFANDPVTTKWGRLRAKYGHPAPFGLKYIEIGNENGGPSYDHNYPIMASALAAKFPHILQIADAWGGVPPGRLTIIDEHFYPGQKWFLNHSHLYDHVSRNGPEIFVGEYAVGNTRARYGDFRSTLAETAFMIGMERNCDIVRMASYGVTLDNAGAVPARINLIQFNDRTAFARSSYWVQYLFNHNRPATVLPAVVHITGYRRPGPHPQRFYADAGLSANRKTMIIKMDNPTQRTINVAFTISGLTGVGTAAVSYTLHEKNPGLDNTFRHPHRVIPVKRKFNLPGANFTYSAAPHSIIVLRLPVSSPPGQ